MATITKASLARYLSDNIGHPKTKALEAVDVLFEAMTSSICNGKRIEIRGFGSWEVKETKEKTQARNPSTGETVYVPARPQGYVQTRKDSEKGAVPSPWNPEHRSRPASRNAETAHAMA